MDALYLASDKTVRAILTALCDDSEVKDKALAYLDRLEPEAKVKARAPGMGESINKKRKAESEIKICVQCDDTFLEDDNSPRNCRYHSGDMEMDDDSSAWYDWDERCHGTMDSKENRKLYPDGFVWTCCDEEGSAPGCKYGRHQSNPEKSKKGS
ncbi:hypothetical protein QBC46DRAFT_397417 [Diplogelasinospora grovesii]|uniref:Uncharacterized protein n=1 Tax=Diplogelasinospora grovesii TaxID=303347 RepID=A0AAN6MY47_9PEZI|nr:hypothetical protein QBC46DRAFT_397417 [Diplogelasinospora grovesii]